MRFANGLVDTSDRGGVVLVDAALLQLSTSEVTGGQANYGGGIYLQNGGDRLAITVGAPEPGSYERTEAP